MLRLVEDLSVRDTASALRLSEGAVKRYTADGLRRLDAALGTTASTDETLRVTPTVTTSTDGGAGR
ncbi:hypothetical protein OMK64_15235 [Cellulomonas fimi]|uniref:hypothetical protein n=1 Tax=Cellulomonas fimi TaxID=1708 RepID=UPI00234E169F|nr:hypothetical protein [Cellulomonas fimi]MDC7122887.1 hypothetical protein [Cellulomonas fimi]